MTPEKAVQGQEIHEKKETRREDLFSIAEVSWEALRPLPDLKWCWDCVKLHEMAHSELCRGEKAPAG